MAHDHPSPKGHFQQDAMPEHLSVTHRRLLDDGVGWRAQHQPSVGLWDYLHTVASTPMPASLARDLPVTGNKRDSLLIALSSQSSTQRRRIFIIPIVAAIVVVVLLMLVFSQLGVHHSQIAAQPTPTLTDISATQPQNTTLPLPAHGFLGNISFSSAGDGWATGGVIESDIVTTNVSSSMGFLLHYHSGTWTRYQKSFAGADIGPISMLSADDGWAFGTPVLASNNQPVNSKLNTPFFLHYIGGQWVTVAIPQLHYSQSIDITKLHMFSSDTGWATGIGNAADSQAIVLIYDHGLWSDITPPPDNGNLVDVSMISPSEGWSVDNENTIAHYLDNRWTTIVPSTLPGGQVKLDHVSMRSSLDGWISGTASTGDPHTGLNAVSVTYFALHYDGTNWKLATLPVTPPAGYGARDFVNSVFVTLGAGNAEYVANFTNQPSPNHVTNAVVVLYLVNGHWVQEYLPTTGITVTQLLYDGQGGVWALGGNLTGIETSTYIFYWHDGIWHTYGHG